MTYKYSSAERAYTLLAGDRPILCFGAVTFREAQQLTQEHWLKGDLLSHQSNAESLWDGTARLSVRRSTADEEAILSQAAKDANPDDGLLLAYLVELDDA
jgi:hypothetical protein